MAKLYGQDAIKWALANPDQARSYLNGSAAVGNLAVKQPEDTPYLNIPLVGGFLSAQTKPFRRPIDIGASVIPASWDIYGRAVNNVNMFDPNSDRVKLTNQMLSGNVGIGGDINTNNLKGTTQEKLNQQAEIQKLQNNLDLFGGQDISTRKGLGLTTDKERSDFWKNPLLETLKDAAGIVAWAIPGGEAFGGGLTGAVASNAIGGGLGSFGASKAGLTPELLKDTLTGAAIGGTIGGVGQTLSRGGFVRSAISDKLGSGSRAYNKLQDLGILNDARQIVNPENIANDITGSLQKGDTNQMLAKITKDYAHDTPTQVEALKALKRIAENKGDDTVVSSIDQLVKMAGPEKAGINAIGENIVNHANDSELGQFRRELRKPTKDLGGVKLFKDAKDLGFMKLGDSPEKIAQKTDAYLNAHGQDVSKQIHDASLESNATIDLTDVYDDLSKRLGKAKFKEAGAPMEDSLSLLQQGTGGKKEMGLADAYELKQQLGRFTKKTFGADNASAAKAEEYNKLYGALNDKIDVALKGLGKPGLREANKKISTAISLNKHLDNLDAISLGGKKPIDFGDVFFGGAGLLAGNPLAGLALIGAKRALGSDTAQRVAINSQRGFGNKLMNAQMPGIFSAAGNAFNPLAQALSPAFSQLGGQALPILAGQAASGAYNYPTSSRSQMDPETAQRIADMYIQETNKQKKKGKYSK